MRQASLIAAVAALFIGCSGIETNVSALVAGGRAIPRRHNFIGVYRPSSSTWFLNERRPGWAGSAPADQSFVYGNPNDTPLVGDWDGNGSETPGVWRAGSWFLKNSLSGGFADVSFRYGDPTDVPLVGDWDGDGITTPGVFRNGTFFLRNSNTTGVADVVFTFGDVGDIPVAGDWDGDGVDTVGVYRPSTATFYLINKNVSGRPADIVAAFGDDGDKPVIGDWDEDGVSTFGIKRGSAWFLRNTNATGIGEISVGYGDPKDIPISGNWVMNATRGFSTVPASLQNFFPLAADYQPASSFRKWKNRGINTVVRVPVNESIETWTSRANALGLKMIRDARPNPANDANEPNLLAWHIFDEPDIQGTAAVASIQARYRQLKGFSSRLVFPNFVGSLVANLGDRCDGLGDSLGDGGAAATCYPGLLAAADWVSQDYYPVVTRDDLAKIGKITSKLTRWAPGKPQFTYIEASPLLRNGLKPTPAQFRAEIWTAIIHGARGIFYFPHGGCDPCQTPDAMPPELINEMLIHNSLISSLASVLQSAINPETIGFRGTLPLEATWRQSGGKNYYFVLNFSTRTVIKQIRVTGFTPTGAFKVVRENRSVGASGHTSFTDTFAPYQLHIYRTP